MLDLSKLLEAQPPGSVTTLYHPEANPEVVALQPFAFVLNVSNMGDSSGVAIASGYTLRRARKQEVEFTKKLIASLFGEHFGPGLWETRRPKTGSGKYLRLPEKQWRYFVIEFGSDNEDLELLQEAFAIAPNELEIGFTLSTASMGAQRLPVAVFRPPRLFQSLSALVEDRVARIFTKADAHQTTEIYRRLAAYDHNILDLHRILKLLMELKDLPRFSPLQVLGYFAILESLLTHQPNPDDRYDSITRQITQKLALLNRRWQPALDESSFGQATHDKIWSKMYGYRSAIAHGIAPDFKSKLEVLGTADHANVLIRNTVKRTIRQALVEPQLVADLHNC